MYYQYKTDWQTLRTTNMTLLQKMLTVICGEVCQTSFLTVPKLKWRTASFMKTEKSVFIACKLLFTKADKCPWCTQTYTVWGKAWSDTSHIITGQSHCANCILMLQWFVFRLNSGSCFSEFNADLNWCLMSHVLSFVPKTRLRFVYRWGIVEC